MYDMSNADICYGKKENRLNGIESANKECGLLQRVHFPGDDKGSFDELFYHCTP